MGDKLIHKLLAMNNNSVVLQQPQKAALWEKMQFVATSLYERHRSKISINDRQSCFAARFVLTSSTHAEAKLAQILSVCKRSENVSPVMHKRASISCRKISYKLKFYEILNGIFTKVEH